MNSMKSTLGDVADFINGAAFKPEDWGDEGNRIIRIQNLTDKDKPYNRTTRTVSERIHVQPGDLLVSWSATLGVFEWDGPDIAYLNQHIFRVVPDLQKVDKRYLRHALELALLDMRQHLHGATMLHVNRGEFLSTKLYLPPIPEQRRIAAILDKADALRTKRREALAQLDRLAQSIFVEMFGDPTTNPKGWDVVELQELVIDGDNINYGVIQPGDDLEEGVPLIRVGDMVSGTINHDALKRISPSIEADYKRSRLVGDELLLSCVGSIGAVALVTEKEQGFNIARAVARIRPRRDVSRDFLAIQLSLPSIQSYFRQELRTVSQPTLNIKQINETKVLRPPEGTQRAFSERISVFKRLHQSHCAANEALQDTFVALQHRAFRGEL